MKGVTASQIKASVAQSVLHCSISSCRHTRDSHWHREKGEGGGEAGGGAVKDTEAIGDNRCVKGGFTLIFLRDFQKKKVSWSEYRLFSCKMTFVFPLYLVQDFWQRIRHLLNFHAPQLKRQKRFKGNFLISNTDAPRLQDWEWSLRMTDDRICWIFILLLQGNEWLRTGLMMTYTQWLPHYAQSNTIALPWILQIWRLLS